MTPRERVCRTLRFEKPDRTPRDLWVLPAASMKYQPEIEEVLREFPPDFERPPYTPARMDCQRGNSGIDLEYVDEWGSGWQAKQPGVIGEVISPRIKSWSDLSTFSPPFEILGKGMEQVNEACARSDKFILASSVQRPFERMQFLRGTQNLFMDLAYGVKEVYQLRDMVHDYYLQEITHWAKTDVDALMFMDDWGTQKALLISPQMWREVFKPLYRDYANVAKEHGKFIFMHSDGHIESIYQDLIELGISAVNSQLFCMDIERIGRDYGGKITFWGEIDRQNLLPFGREDQVRQGVRRVLNSFSHIDGGLIAQCEWGPDVCKANVRAVFDEFTP